MPEQVSTIEVIEARYQQPFKEVLVDLYEKHQKSQQVAKELGVSRGTLWLLMKIAGLSVRDLQLAVAERRHERGKQKEG